MSILETSAVMINEYPAEKYNRLFPCTITQLSPLHKVMVNVVNIDPDNKAEVYTLKTGGLALTKIACMKLMTAANVVMEDSRPILPAACNRCTQVARMTRVAPQCGKCPTNGDVAYQVSILVPEPSGGVRRYIATKEVNKDHFVAKNGGPDKAPIEHMAAQCESKALLRALRSALGIQGSYTKEQLKKPFAVALVVLNAHDPDLRAAIIQRFAQSQDALFGRGQGSLSAIGSMAAISEGTVHVEPEEPDDEDGDGEPDRSENQCADQTIDEGEPPWLQAQVACADCRSFIEDAQGHTAEQIADYSMRNFGRALCVPCQNAARKQRKGA